MMDISIGDKFYYNPEDEGSIKYYGNCVDWCNSNNAAIYYIGVVDTEVEENYNVEENGDIVNKTRRVVKPLRQFQIQLPPAPTEKDLLQKEKEELQEYLIKTDYIASKLAEVSDDTEAFNALKEKYAEDLNKRKQARERINEIEKNLNDK